MLAVASDSTKTRAGLARMTRVIESILLVLALNEPSL